MKSASTQQQVMAVLAAELAALQKYRTGMQALQAPPDAQVTVALSKLLIADLSAIDNLEGAIRQLQADVNRGDQNAFNRDGNSAYKTAYDALLAADSHLGMSVQVDAAG